MDPDDLSEEGLSVGEGDNTGQQEIREEIKEEVKENIIDQPRKRENNTRNENRVRFSIDEEDDIQIEEENKEVDVGDDDNMIGENETKEPIFKGRDPMELELNATVKPYDERKSKTKEEEGLLMYYMTYSFEILYTFVLSLIPLWSDDFEQNNPIIKPTQQVTRVDDAEQRGIEMNELQNRENNTQSEKSEKLIYKSSVDTKLVNNEESQQKYHLVEEDQENRTENEFVFSENVNIDTLSYNEPIVESLKKKYQDGSNTQTNTNDENGNNLNK
jgi:hypothetical protein